MKRTIFALFVLLLAATAQAQSSFSIGPRISNYSTDLDSGPIPFETGRQTAFGLVGDYRNGAFVLDYFWERDPENGIRLTDIVLDVGNYERNRGEVTVGFSFAQMLDLQGGIRIEDSRIGGASIFGSPVLQDLEMETQALTAGIKLHGNDSGPVSFYALGRGYLGTTEVRFTALPDDEADMTGWRVEAGLPIRLGQSNWRIVPGVELERLETDQYDIVMNTNRVFLNFVYRSR